MLGVNNSFYEYMVIIYTFVYVNLNLLPSFFKYTSNLLKVPFRGEKRDSFLTVIFFEIHPSFLNFQVNDNVSNTCDKIKITLPCK